jgi:hypothetical protein
VLEFTYPGAPKREAQYPLQLTAHTKWSYFEPREKFNLLAMIKGNPMFMIMLFGVGMMTMMPKVSYDVKITGSTPRLAMRVLSNLPIL